MTNPRPAAKRYRAHVLNSKRCECARGGVCTQARRLDADASAESWRRTVERS